jgi:hypothetical protein
MARPSDNNDLEDKTARFTVLVEKSGAPELYTHRMKPVADRRYHTLYKAHKVMTIQTSDAGTEFGIAEYCERKGARYLSFPKSLKRFEQRRIVGINWDLVAK